MIRTQAGTPIRIGWEGENIYREVSFDLAALGMIDYGIGTVTIAYRRPGDEEPYPIVPRVEGQAAIWTVTDTDVAKRGYGELQLRNSVGNIISKCVIFEVIVKKSLGTEAEPPDPYQSWFDKIIEATGKYPRIDLTTRHWFVWDVTEEEWTDTGIIAQGEPGEPGEPGEDGFSPIISETKVGKVTTVTVTTAAGTHTFQIHDGEDGVGGDMMKNVYDTNRKEEDIFDYADNAAGEVAEDLETHETDTSIHVTEAKKAEWDAKSDFSGSYEDLEDKPTIPDELADLAQDATHRTVTDAEKTAWNAKADADDIPTMLSELSGDATHRTVTDIEKAAWNGEPALRQAADTDLQSQIDAIVSRSDVVDVVNVYDRGADTTKTDIVHYDTTSLLTNDVVKVMQDETHSNAISYFRWSGTAWNYVGSQGPFYTKGEADAKFALIDDIPTQLSELSGDSTHRTVTDMEKAAWNEKSDFSGDYDDLTNKPSIPDELADLAQDATHRTVTDTEKTTWNGKAAKNTSFQVTLTAAGWSSNAQTVSNANILTGLYDYFVAPSPSSFSNYAEAVIYADEVTVAGQMTFHCTETPTANIVVNIVRSEHA